MSGPATVTGTNLHYATGRFTGPGRRREDEPEPGDLPVTRIPQREC